MSANTIPAFVAVVNPPRAHSQSEVQSSSFRASLASHSAYYVRVPRGVQMEYIAADGYGFDYVMVFKLQKAGVMTDYATETVKKIMAAGLKVRVYFSCSKEEVFCEMRAPVERLMQFADQVCTINKLANDPVHRMTKGESIYAGGAVQSKRCGRAVQK